MLRRLQNRVNGLTAAGLSRWEKSMALPVHRVHNSKSGSVPSLAFVRAKPPACVVPRTAPVVARSRKSVVATMFKTGAET